LHSNGSNENYDIRNQIYNFINKYHNIAKYKEIINVNAIYDPVSTLMKNRDEILYNYDNLPKIIRDNGYQFVYLYMFDV